jgi:hypothetical protein
MATLTTAQMEEMTGSLRVYQARADALLRQLGLVARGPLASTDPNYANIYRRQLADQLVARFPEDSEYHNLPVDTLPNNAFNVFEPQIYAEADIQFKKPTVIATSPAARNDTSAPPGALVYVTTTDPTNKQQINSFYGKESFVKWMGRPCRRIKSIDTKTSGKVVYVDKEGHILI